jgi:hypothetical protein
MRKYPHRGCRKKFESALAATAGPICFAGGARSHHAHAALASAGQQGGFRLARNFPFRQGCAERRVSGCLQRLQPLWAFSQITSISALLAMLFAYGGTRSDKLAQVAARRYRLGELASPRLPALALAVGEGNRDSARPSTVSASAPATR